MRRLYYGGSFNPICNHHLLIAQYVREKEGFDEVHFVPCYSPPHKAELADYGDRFEMLNLAIAGREKEFQVNIIEEALYLLDDKPSYTIDTVRGLKEFGEQETEVTLLVGADSELHKWHEAEALQAEAKFIITPREAHHCGPAFHTFDKDGRIVVKNKTYLDMPLFQMSATEVRKRVASGLPIGFMVPKAVEAYIMGNGLYR